MKRNLIVLLLILTVGLQAQNQDLIINIDGRKTTSLNGHWSIIIDPYENGYYDYRYQPKENGYFKNEKPQNRWDLIEYHFDKTNYLNVPGDWNSQRKELFWYEGTIWYKKSFQIQKKPNRRLFIYFGAANYQAKVYVNGKFVGEHVGGFTPFNFEVTNVVQPGDNFVVVKVDNKRLRKGVPTLNTDWFNYGGLTRRVMLVELPQNFIRDYFIQLKPDSKTEIEGWIQCDGKQKKLEIELSVPELDVNKKLMTDEKGFTEFSLNADLVLWSPQNPKLYDVKLSTKTDTLKDWIGFRNIETSGTDIMLNGKPIFLSGISIHEEAPFMDGARAFSKEHAQTLLSWAKDLGCNFVRLAHYPHNELIVRIADEMGLLVWSEIPVYWTILWENNDTYRNAENQLTEMITRDKNRASVIMWSVGNETPLSDARLKFMKGLIEKTRKLDPTRLITAAMERHYIDSRTQMIDDPLGKFVDVLGCNEYIGWYDGLPAKCDSIQWETVYEKPLIISEFGGAALYDYHGDELTRWTEEYQASVYRHNLEMLEKVDFLRGMTPWILKDFRSPRRPLSGIQDYWNRKGLINDRGERKKAFYILQKFYRKKSSIGQ